MNVPLAAGRRPWPAGGSRQRQTPRRFKDRRVELASDHAAVEARNLEPGTFSSLPRAREPLHRGTGQRPHVARLPRVLPQRRTNPAQSTAQPPSETPNPLNAKPPGRQHSTQSRQDARPRLRSRASSQPEAHHTHRARPTSPRAFASPRLCVEPPESRGHAQRKAAKTPGRKAPPEFPHVFTHPEAQHTDRARPTSPRVFASPRLCVDLRIPRVSASRRPRVRLTPPAAQSQTPGPQSSGSHPPATGPSSSGSR